MEEPHRCYWRCRVGLGAVQVLAGLGGESLGGAVELAARVTGHDRSWSASQADTVNQ
ncbi:hypothetical protein AB0E08_49025 [Streptomyces sp. NPDC048281]|uniref:hypothetical protein n=1 Tax=Streptomyces sp. NPDC048281 TaxID=3154715 RepID=UPI00342700D2